MKPNQAAANAITLPSQRALVPKAATAIGRQASIDSYRNHVSFRSNNNVIMSAMSDRSGAQMNNAIGMKSVGLSQLPAQADMSA